MSQLEELEQRVAALEQQMKRLASPPQSEWKDWRKALERANAGELAEEIEEAGRQIREADRQAARHDSP